MKNGVEEFMAGIDDHGIDVLRRGDKSGNDMVIRVMLSSGREVYGFATENVYGGYWDLGPTWNYVITGEKCLLWDSGRRGMGPRLREMLGYAGFKVHDLDSVILSHGHEDHDGGLFGLTNSEGTQIVAHEIYEVLRKVYPLKAPSPQTETYPASCWRCAMPESFTVEHCVDYHRERQQLKVTAIPGSKYELAKGIAALHVPGHSPDSLALLIDDEVMLSGDTILPDITPQPTQERFFSLTRAVLPERYREAQEIYGLRAYIRSLRKLQKLGRDDPKILVLPGHRLFYNDGWQVPDLERKIDDLVEHHVIRCSDILDILRDGPLSAEDVARRYFEPKLLKGFGILMAVNEVDSHCELLEISGDAMIAEDGKIVATGERHFESLIKGLGV